MNAVDEAAVGENDDLSSISFGLYVEATIGERAQDIVDYAESICHVQSALREELHADISVIDEAFC